MSIVSVRLPEDVHDAYARYALALDVPLSELLRDILVVHRPRNPPR